MRVPCPTCKRRGTVDKAFPEGIAMGYCGPNGERWPQETCQTCMGSGWVNDDRRVQTDAEKQLREICPDCNYTDGFHSRQCLKGPV